MRLVAEYLGDELGRTIRRIERDARQTRAVGFRAAVHGLLGPLGALAASCETGADRPGQEAINPSGRFSHDENSCCRPNANWTATMNGKYAPKSQCYNTKSHNRTDLSETQVVGMTRVDQDAAFWVRASILRCMLFSARLPGKWAEHRRSAGRARVEYRDTPCAARSGPLAARHQPLILQSPDRHPRRCCSRFDRDPNTDS
jgi:hypothetical protein